MTILDGKKYSEELFEEYKERVKNYGKEIGFAIIWIGNNEASRIYVNNKLKKCEMIGIKPYLYHLEDDVLENDVLKLIDELNERNDIKGILLQSPVPKQIDIIKCFNRIKEEKDVDGFADTSIGKLVQGKPNHISCTPKGIIKLLDYYNIDLVGKNVCIINRTIIVGKPLFQLFISRGATVTMCHSKTKNLAFHTKNADIVVSAVGKPKFITADMIKDGAIVLDVGISRIDGKVVGDVDPESVYEKASYIAPVPGGIGPMTIAMIFENIIDTLEKER